MELIEALRRCPVIAILRGVRPEEVVAIGEALFVAGVRVIEVPLNSPEPLRSIEALASRFGQAMLIGAGTVVTTGEVTAVAGAGGRLIVSPNADAAVVAATQAAGLASCPGAFTPTEAFAMLSAGAHAIKLFPAEVAGQAGLRALLAVLPSGTALIPVGGVDAVSMPAWRAAGAAGVGAGSSVYRPGDPPVSVGAKAAALMTAWGELQ